MTQGFRKPTPVNTVVQQVKALVRQARQLEFNLQILHEVGRRDRIPQRCLPTPHLHGGLGAQTPIIAPTHTHTQILIMITMMIIIISK